MQRVKRYFFVGLTIVLSSFEMINPANAWKIAEDYVVEFSGSGAEGTFRGLKGTIVFDPNAPEQAQIEVAVDVRTIDTGNKTKDKHARGDSWFDAERFPEILFRSSAVTQSGERYQMTGTLTLHGTEKEITFPFSFVQTGDKGVFEGGFTVDREEYGIKGPFFGFVVGDDFEVSLKIPVTK